MYDAMSEDDVPGEISVNQMTVLGPIQYVLLLNVPRLRKKPLWLRFPGSLSGCQSFSFLRSENLTV